LHQLNGLPPSLILTCECDIIRDEEETYISKFLEAGVYTEVMLVFGTIHGYMGTHVPEETSRCRSSLHMIVDFFKDQLKL
jgi:acetyl esterase